VGANSGQRGRKAGRQRLALIVFGALFVLLFAGFAVAQGIGRESVPEGDVAIVEDGPEGANTVSEAEFRKAVLQQALQGGLKKVPKEGSTRYEELKGAALGELLDFIWIQGEAEELDLTATKKQMDEELEKIKEQNFPTPAAYKEFLETSKLTQADVDKRVKLQVLSNQITEAVQGNAGAPSSAEIEEYYDASKATQFTTKASRDIRIITNKDKAEVEAAKAALEKDDSPASWKKVAQKYSSDPSTKSKGGLQEGLTEELLATAGPLKKAVFDGAANELVGPLSYQGNYTLIEVVKLNSEKVQELAEVRSQITSTLQQKAQEEFFEGFVRNYQSKWESRTVCASGFEIERCSNYKGDGRPATANPACYEENPKAPATECPAPVTSNTPALPGTVTILQPKGEQFPQRPVPVAAAEGAAGGASEVLPEGVEAAPGE
jgi:parvulin-like peptidyl-prolyl isomerase